ncbi:lycopene cyclase domain-containing protein [Lacibacter sediminis]|uniref:Lycopene cyclase domain-containing protein n=1 Tax=Lacibacter sediminis TaxID=2760713 RepID=A0A7G5XHS7_9BACT|nr:lycopene cyclase domain-containing protein [Lacibacter sediminis]QNA45030.1 lycopene cyclase domain-containing protein [Lacibacter sediminis]
MNYHYTYFLILAASLAGPLLLSFDKKVAFYKKWKYLFPAMLLPALFFLVWDEFKTKAGVWSFSDDYITGIKLSSLPLEEVLFFFVVPYCCVFIYECIVCYFPSVKQKNRGRPVLMMMGVLFLIAATLTYGKAYTFYTSLFNALFIAALFLFQKWFRGFNATAFLISYLVVVIPFLIVNGLLTGIPVVLYNDTENLGFRIFSFLPWPLNNIPVEDIFYGMLLILMNVALFERLRTKAA